MKRSNKIDALLLQLSSGQMENDKVKLLHTLSFADLTLAQIVSMGWKIQTASGRLADLEEMGLVRKTYNPNSKYSTYSFVKTSEEQKELREDIQREKLLKYFSKGCELNYIIFNDKNNTWEFNMSLIKF
jgi:DNA-binding MarR family transcriptional regulator